MITRVSVGSGTVSILPVVKGLVSEATVVRDRIASGGYRAVALSISPEELKTLADNPTLEAETANLEEDVYLRELSRFGEVAKPPPCFVQAVNISLELDIPCYGVDLPEEAFTEVYIREVKGLEMVRYSLGLKKLASHRFPEATPQEFVVEFDNVINRLRGHRRVEEAREEHMAQGIAALLGEGSGVLALIEYERFAGVHTRLLEIEPRTHTGPDR